jgi:hypothetical protein
LWVEHPREALAFYEAAFGAAVVHCVGENDDIVAQLQVGDAAFWVAATSPDMKRYSPHTVSGTTSRTLPWWRIRTMSSGKRWLPVPLRVPPFQTSTGGDSAG